MSADEVSTAVADRERWEADVALADGGVVHVRPIRPEDGPRLERFHERQSPESIYFRFFSPRPRLSARDVERFTHVDYLDRMAMVAILGEEMIGVARYDRHPTRSDAEVAFFSDDEHRGRGVATVLLEYLAAFAREAGISGFTAQVLPDNRRMLRVFTQAGFGATSKFEDGVIEVRLEIEPTEEGLAAIEQRAAMSEAASVGRLLAPTSVAVIGASRQEGTIGHVILRHLLDGGFDGPVYPVNPEATSVGSVRAVPTVIDVPGEVDLAVVVVPAEEVLAVVRDCARKRVHSLLVVSKGFAEGHDEEGAERERELVSLARSNGMRLIGPKSVGIVNTDATVGLLATVAATQPLAGVIGVSSQSSTVGVAILEHLRLLGLGISSFVDLGNKADVSSSDLLQYWEHDERTKLVILYMESFGNPRNFNRIARRIGRSKPIVAMKPARALPGAERLGDPEEDLADEAVDTLLRQTGVIRVETLDELLGVTRLLADQPLPQGNHLGLVSNGWSPALLAADAAVANGLVLDPGSPNVRVLGSDAGPDDYRAAVAALLDEKSVDCVLALYSPLFGRQADDVAQSIADAAAADPAKPVVAAFLGSLEPFTAVSGGCRVPVFLFPDRAARALARLAAHQAWRSCPPGELPVFDDIDGAAVRTMVAAIIERDPEGRWLSIEECTRLLNGYGMTLVQHRLAGSIDEAVDAARDLGYPVALKATGLARLNTTEAGGVSLDVYGDEELRAAYLRMSDLHGEAMQPALVQAMVAPGLDTSFGIARPPVLGSILSFGQGGAIAEGPGAVADRHLVPITDEEAHRFVAGSHLIGELAEIGDGAVEAAEALVMRLAALADVVPEIAELRLNPVILTESGASITNARIRLAPVKRPEPSVRRLR